MQRAFRGWTMRASYWFSKGWLFSRLNKSPWKLSFGTNPQPQPRIFDNGHLFFVCSWGSPAVIPQWTVLRIPFHSRIEFTQSPSQSAPTILVLKTWVSLWPWKKIRSNIWTWKLQVAKKGRCYRKEKRQPGLLFIEIVWCTRTNSSYPRLLRFFCWPPCLSFTTHVLLISSTVLSVYFKMSFLVSSIIPKIERKQFDLRYHSSKVEFFCSFFGRIEDTKKTFWI